MTLRRLKTNRKLARIRALWDMQASSQTDRHEMGLFQFAWLIATPKQLWKRMKFDGK